MNLKYFFANNKIFIFLENSYIIKLNLNGKIEFIKLPTKLILRQYFQMVKI